MASRSCSFDDSGQLSDAGIDLDEDEILSSRGLDTMGTGTNTLSTPTSDKFYPRIDSYRFSMANLEDSQDVELDAILGELCALESQFDQEIGLKSHSRTSSSVSQTGSDSGVQKQGTISYMNTGNTQRYVSHSRSSSGGGTKFDIPGLQYDTEQSMRNQLRTDSPDADSAFSDTVSMLSSESSASSGASGRPNEALLSSSKNTNMALASPTQLLDNIIDRLHVIRNDLLDKENTPPAEQAARIKAEKIKIALEKIKEASVKKLFIKAFTADNSTKSLLVDEKMTTGYVCKLLADKNHVKMDPKWVLVEQFPDLYMERIYEDHENLVSNLMMWTRDSKNKLLYLERPEKYDLFIHPENYLLVGASSEKGADLDDDARSTLLEEFFTSSCGASIPEIEGNLYLKSEGKKAWKKHYFVLRASGLYYAPKGKSKSSKDLICLVTFEMNHVYVGCGWKKKFKAPTDYCFALKHPQIQTKSSKYIKYLCAEDDRTLKQWIMGIRIAKYGRLLMDNYEMLMRELAEEDLDALAHARSFSVTSMAKTLQISPDASNGSSTSSPSSESKDVTVIEKGKEKAWRMSRQDSIRSSSSSSGCLSEHGSGARTPTAIVSSDTSSCGFDADFPAMGTIKRKPSMAPKIPLTSTTRNIAKQSMTEEPAGVDYDAVSISSGSSSGSGGLQMYASLNHRVSIGERYAMMRRGSGSFSNQHQMSTNQKLLSPDDVDDLPLPPPPELGSTLELDSLDSVLPPPPPEAFSEVAMDSLPPPPSPKTFRDSGVYNDQTSDVTSPSSIASNYSLPSPPPPPAPPVTINERFASQYATLKISPQHNRRASEADMGQLTPPPFLAELKNNQTLSPKSIRKSSQSYRKMSVDPSLLSHEILERSAKVVTAQKSGSCLSVMAPPPPPPPPPPAPPAPPLPNNFSTLRSCKSGQPQSVKKNENKKSLRFQTLPTPPRRSSNASQAVPPNEFLQDLQRVMHKKWNMAQKLHEDVKESPNKYVMGFRDPTFCPSERPFCAPPASETVRITPKKKPPPPPPKRSETTQLSKS